MGTWNWNWVLCRSSKCSWQLNHLSSPWSSWWCIMHFKHQVISLAKHRSFSGQLRAGMLFQGKCLEGCNTYVKLCTHSEMMWTQQLSLAAVLAFKVGNYTSAASKPPCGGAHPLSWLHIAPVSVWWWPEDRASLYWVFSERCVVELSLPGRKCLLTSKSLLTVKFDYLFIYGWRQGLL